MRRASGRAVQVTLASAAAIALVLIGCGADGSGDVVEDSPTDPQATEPGNTLPPSQPGTDTPPPASTGTTQKDAGPKQVDAGPPPPDPGTPCTNIDEIKTRSCGACGTQSTLCEAQGDGGAGKWSEYGVCTGELAGGCVPGTVVTESCGNCGTVTKTCNKYCAFSSSVCSGQPTSSCAPGNVDFSSASCADPTTYRQRTCGSACTYGSFSASCSAPPATIQVGVGEGQVTGTLVNLTSTKTTALLGGSCPTATISTTATTPYAYVTVHNPNAKAATVAIFNTQAPGGSVVSTELAAYTGNAAPANDTARKACVKIATYGTTSLTGNFSFASLDGTKAVTIPAGGDVVVYVAGKTATATGTVALQAQLVSLSP